PEQVPPLEALFDRSSEKSPVKPGVLICTSQGSANIRTFSASMKTGLIFWSPYPTAVNSVELLGCSASSWSTCGSFPYALAESLTSRLSNTTPTSCRKNWRSEERRVGKECG